MKGNNREWHSVDADEYVRCNSVLLVKDKKLLAHLEKKFQWVSY